MGEIVTEGLNRIQAAGSTSAPGCGPTFEKRRAEKSSPAPSKGDNVQGSSGAGAPLPPGDEDPEKSKRKVNCTKQESPVWRNAKSYKGEYKRSPDGKEVYKWDHLHNDIEVFNARTGEHIGSKDPITGFMYKFSKGYRIKP